MFSFGAQESYQTMTVAEVSNLIEEKVADADFAMV